VKCFSSIVRLSIVRGIVAVTIDPDGATGVDQKQGVGIGGTLLRSGQVIDAEGVAAGMAAGGAKLDAARQPVS